MTKGTNEVVEGNIDEVTRVIEKEVDAMIWQFIRGLPELFPTRQVQEAQLEINRKFFWDNFEVVLEAIPGKPGRAVAKIRARPGLDGVRAELQKKLQAKKHAIQADLGMKLEEIMGASDEEE